MSLLESLNKDMVQAMKNKDKERLTTVRMLKAAVQNEALKLRKQDLTLEEEITVLSRELKQRKDSYHEFSKAGREDLLEKLNIEIMIVQEYMPKQMSEEEITKVVQETIAETGAASKADFGKVMGALMPKVKGKADGAMVNQIVKNLLQ
ncbi:MAG: hypothetical protein K0R71_168 [Bacillales bacterium]|jgi:uncharacterized protein YqeY|nr:hypothetical protein [Bacillales bacterium]